eukprot:NODE_4069_length_866_cov_38.088127_g3754_i0.p1 GENE.NODE_4069_length_866_cov_38.088127_g3754_i0~~NODE_4069_length_866_cov_38.088127_g3754_i0.p1  ORF type:complete len:189 (-),score=33.68 NODE_4069_length_866_cov_38.088127_g3754_i0:209-775(-)
MLADMTIGLCLNSLQYQMNQILDNLVVTESALDEHFSTHLPDSVFLGDYPAALVLRDEAAAALLSRCEERLKLQPTSRKLDAVVEKLEGQLDRLRAAAEEKLPNRFSKPTDCATSSCSLAGKAPLSCESMKVAPNQPAGLQSPMQDRGRRWVSVGSPPTSMGKRVRRVPLNCGDEKRAKRASRGHRQD